MCEELKFRFSFENLTPYKGLFAIPSKIVKAKSDAWKEEFMLFADMYKDDFPNFISIPEELDLWGIHWRDHIGPVPRNVAETLKAVSYDGYANIKVALLILATLPITSCECERSFSAMKRLKTYTRSVMAPDRMNGLALLHIHQELNPDPEKVIKKYGESGSHRLEII